MSLGDNGKVVEIANFKRAAKLPSEPETTQQAEPVRNVLKGANQQQQHQIQQTQVQHVGVQISWDNE